MATYVRTGGNYEASENMMDFITDTGTTVQRDSGFFMYRRSPWRRGLRRGSVTTRLLGS